MASDHRRLGPADIVTLVVLDVVIVGLGLLIGWLLDKVAESAPLLALFGFVVGMVIAVILTWSRLSRAPGTHGR